MNDFKKFREELPSKKKFHSSLTEENLVTKNMNLFFCVWKKIEMKTMKGYYNLYLKYDVLLSANVFETFRKNSLKNYRLCPSHYLSAPDLSSNALFIIRKIKLELIPDT